MVLDSANYSGPPDCAPALVVVAGQSNALGYTLGPDDLPPHLRGPIARVMIWDSASQAFTPLQAGVNTGTGQQSRRLGPRSAARRPLEPGPPVRRPLCGEVRPRRDRPGARSGS